MLRDIDKDTIDFIPNYDESQLEPSVLPAEFPNMLVNGAGGIAVGMATNIPPHNPGEVIRACKALIENPNTTLEELMEHPQIEANGLFKEISSSNQGQVRALRFPAKFNNQELMNHSPAPALGEHKAEIINSLE